MTRQVFPSKVGSPAAVGRTHGRASAGHFLTAMKAAAGFPGRAGSAGVRRRRGFRGVQAEGSGGAARGERRGAGGAPRSPSRRRGASEGGSLPARGHPMAGSGAERGPGPMPSASGLSGSHPGAEPEADSHFLSPEALDSPRRVALPGGEPAPLRASAPDTSTNLARRRRDIYCVPPPPAPTAARPKPSRGRGGRRAEGESRAPAGRAWSCGSCGRRASRSGRSFPVGSVGTGGLWGRSRQHPPRSRLRSGLTRLPGAGPGCGRSPAGPPLT